MYSSKKHRSQGTPINIKDDHTLIFSCMILHIDQERHPKRGPNISQIPITTIPEELDRALLDSQCLL